MSKKCKRVIVLVVIFLTILGFNHIINADIGPKPSLTIHLENLKTKNYVIDLFEDSKENGEYSKKNETNNFDNIAEGRRNNN